MCSGAEPVLAMGTAKPAGAGLPKAGPDALRALQGSLSMLSVLPAFVTRLLPGNFGVTLNSDRDCIEVILMRVPLSRGRNYFPRCWCVTSAAASDDRSPHVPRSPLRFGISTCASLDAPGQGVPISLEVSGH